MTNQPNIVFIICHDLGRYLGCYGADVKTPNLDGLAADGVQFNQAFCSAAQCSPSRGSILTGLSPQANGLMGLAHIGWEFNPGVKTLPMFLNELGYETHLFGMQHESADRDSLGYSNVHNKDSKCREVTPAVANWLRDQRNNKSDQPFYINVGIAEPHRAYPHTDEFYPIDDPAEVTPLPYLPDKSGIRKDISGLNGMVKDLDTGIGRILSALDDTGLRENTLVVFTTDHGLAMPRAKGTCYEAGIEVALLMHWPNHFDGGKKVDHMIPNTDHLPTLVELAGGEAPTDIEGRSYVALVNDEEYQPRDHVFAGMTWHDRYNPMRCVRTERYKYIRNFGDRPSVYLPSDIFVGSAGVDVRDEYYGTRREAEQLFDLQEDPLEENNLFGADNLVEIQSGLSGLVDEWMQNTNDPLLKGDVQPPEKQAEREKTNTVPNG